MTPLILTGKQKNHLRALAHALKPVLQIGKGEVKESVVQEAERQLKIHELIKVKALEGEGRDEIFADLCAKTESALVQTIGKIAVLYKPRADKPKIVLPLTKNPIESESNS